MKKSLLLSLFAICGAYVSAATPVEASLEKTNPVAVTSDFVTYADGEDGWSDAVEGTMVDNILCTGFNMPTATYNVQVKKNFETNSYLIIDPWRGLFDQIGGEGYTSPSMEIDASDPTNPMIPYTETGIYGGEVDGDYYILSMSYYYAANDATCPEEYRISIAEEGENTVITFPYRSMVLYASVSQGFYYAGTDESTITFPTIVDPNAGIGDIVVDNNAEVEYFNLQGLRVENLSQGQILIKRQGTTVNKVIIR